jgi:hypothetical protein
MMPAKPEEELAALQKRMVRVAMIDSVGTLLLAMGLLGKFAGSVAIHPVLKNPNVTTGMLVAGGVIMAWGALQIVTISRRRSAIQQEMTKNPRP